MKPTFLSRRPQWAEKLPPWINNGLLILMVVFFLVPFAVRGARMSFQSMKNDVKEWLPDDFAETRELDWFREHFLGQQFVLVSWPGCSVDDERYHLFIEKVQQELAPIHQREKKLELEGYADFAFLPPERTPEGKRAGMLADDLGLFFAGEDFFNWGGQQEKWFKGDGEKWYYITPEGNFYRWSGGDSLPAYIGRQTRQALTGENRITGELIETFEPEIYKKPHLLYARMFKSISTGPQLVDRLASEGGALWPRGDYSEEEKPEIARNQAHERLTSTLFGPAVYHHFDWTLAEFRRRVPPSKIKELPINWEELFQKTADRVIAEECGGDSSLAVKLPNEVQRPYYEQFFAACNVDPPARQTCILVTLSDVGTRDLKRVVGRPVMGKPAGRILELATNQCQVPAEDLKIGGPPVDNVAIDEEGAITLARLLRYSAIIGLVLAWLCFRSVKLTMMVFFVGGVSAMSALAIIWWTGGTVDAIMLSMPPLVYVLGLSSAVHIVNYYRDTVSETGKTEGAAEHALGLAWWPCTLAAFTTALGLLSLNVSNIVPIQRFGFYSAVGVMATLTVLFSYLPSALNMWPVQFAKRDPDAEVKVSVIERFWLAVGSFIVRRHVLVTFACVAVMAGMAVGLTRINTSIQLLKLFSKDAQIIANYGWLEGNIGKLVPMELVIGVDREKLLPIAEKEEETDESGRDLAKERLQYSFLERVEMIEGIQAALQEKFGEEAKDLIGQGMSTSTFLPEIPEPGSRDRSVYNIKLEEARDLLLAEEYLKLDKQTGRELWRISLRLSALKDVDYGEFVGELKEAVEPVLASHRYRDQILSKLEEKTQGEGYNGTSILFLGMDDPDAPPLPKTTDEPEIAVKPTVAFHELPLADQQTKLFAQSLRDLLASRGFRRGYRFKRQLEWHDPVAFPLQKGLATSPEWGQQMERFSVVVLLKDHADYDLDFIRRHAGVFIDAREHHFQANSNMQIAAAAGAPVQAVYTGIVPIVYKAQRTLLTSLIESIFWAFVMIFAVMAILLNPGRSLGQMLRPKNILLGSSAGLVSMLPNIFPVVIIFGFMGWSDVLIDIGTMMTASVAMGVAVDDTIHFLNWFRKGLSRGLSRQGAVEMAYQRVATAMTQTTLIGGLGLFVFAFSTFTPTQRFGVMMLTLLVAALLGDLILLPALLAGPLGKVFKPKEPKKETAGEPLTQPRRESPQPPAPETSSKGSIPAPHSSPHRPASQLTWRQDKP